jgi:hypothetical protein
MDTTRKLTQRITLLAVMTFMTFTSGGCFATLPFSGTVMRGFFRNAVAYGQFWQTIPPMPVAAYFSEKVEDAYWEEERYDKVPILDPVEGEFAPLSCIDPPSWDEVIRALPDDTGGGFAFLAETNRNNVKIVVEPIVDRLDECRFYPLVGPARMHHCHYKCTVYYDKIIRSNYPIPFSHTDEFQEVVYIDHDHLIRCAGPATPQ